MSSEIVGNSDILKIISPREKEIILLSSVFFWAKYKNKLNRIKLGENIIPNIPVFLFSHPSKSQLFPSLNLDDMENICYELNDIFENQERCVEEGSLYDYSIGDFSIIAADSNLAYISNSEGVYFYNYDLPREVRISLMKLVLAEKLSGETSFPFLLGNEDEAV